MRSAFGFFVRSGIRQGVSPFVSTCITNGLSQPTTLFKRARRSEADDHAMEYSVKIFHDYVSDSPYLR